MFFAIPVIVSGVAFEILLRNIPNDYSYKSHFLDKNAKNIEVLFLGNSHVHFGIDPKYITLKSFNAGNISQSLDYDLKILEKYQNNLKNLRFVVIAVDYFSLFSKLDSGVEAWRIKNYDLYYGMHSDFIPEHHFEIMANQTKYNFERVKKYYLHQKSDLHVTHLGWGTEYAAALSKDLSKVGPVAAKRHRDASDEKLYKGNIKVLQAIIDFCKKKNIKLILFTSPAYKTYSENIDAHQMKRTENALKKFSTANNNVRYYNLLSDSRFDSIDFYDSDHLNDVGAKKLSVAFDSIIHSESRR